MGSPTVEQLSRRLAVVGDDLTRLPGVVGVGIGGDIHQPVVQVYVSAGVPAPSLSALAALLDELPWESVGMSAPEAQEARGGTEDEQAIN